MKENEITDPVPTLIKLPRFSSSIQRRLSLLLSILMSGHRCSGFCKSLAFFERGA